MPKAKLSNDKGLVQSAGDGLTLTAANSSNAGLHFKTFRVDLTTGSHAVGAAEVIFANTGISFPAHSTIVGFNATVDERSTTVAAERHVFSASLHASADLSEGGPVVDMSTILTLDPHIATGPVVANNSTGSFKSSGVNIGTKRYLYLINNGTNTSISNKSRTQSSDSSMSGSVVFNVAFAGVVD